MSIKKSSLSPTISSSSATTNNLKHQAPSPSTASLLRFQRSSQHKLASVPCSSTFITTYSSESPPTTKAPLKTFLLTFLATTTNIAAPLKTRQLAGEGAAADYLLSATDNGVGGAPPLMAKRQGDKMANGAANVINAAGAPNTASTVKTAGDSLDGDLTSRAANLGADAGATEESTLEDAGSALPM